MAKKTSLSDQFQYNGPIKKSKNDFKDVDIISETIHSKRIEILELKIITFRVNANFHRQLKSKLADRGQTIRGYMTGLIKKDLGIEE